MQNIHISQTFITEEEKTSYTPDPEAADKIIWDMNCACKVLDGMVENLQNQMMKNGLSRESTEVLVNPLLWVFRTLDRNIDELHNYIDVAKRK